MEEELGLIRECISQAFADPISYIQQFFDLDDGKRMTIQLTEDELNTLLEMSEDGGLEKQVDSIEEAIIDFHRGFNEASRDENGNAPIVKAILKTGERYLQVAERDEFADLQKKHDIAKETLILTALLGTLNLTETTNTTSILSDFVKQVVGSGSIHPPHAQHSYVESNEESRESQIETERCKESTYPASGVNPDVMPTSSRQRSQSSAGMYILADALGFLVNKDDMDGETRREVENELKRKVFSFFCGKTQ